MSRRAWLAFLLIGTAAPFVVYPVFVMKILCAGLFASAFGLLIGYTGLLSFGHAAFFGIAAYVTGLLAKEAGLNAPLALVAGTVAAAVVGALFGALAIRRQGIYFAMITLALAQLVFFVTLQTPATGGEDGLQGVPRGSVFGLDLGDTLTMYFFVFLIFCFALAFVQRVIGSPFGQALKAVRENEPRAVSLGYDADRLKLLAFVLSAGLAGLAGALNTLVFQLASLSDVHWRLSGEVVLMTLLGGMGTFLGPLVGAALIVALENRLGTSAGSWVQVIIGTTFVICVLAFRRGFVGEFEHLMSTNRKRSRK